MVRVKIYTTVINIVNQYTRIINLSVLFSIELTKSIEITLSRFPMIACLQLHPG